MFRSAVLRRLGRQTKFVHHSNRVPSSKRTFESTSSFVNPVSPQAHAHKIVVVGGGPAGLAVSHQLLRSGNFAPHDIAIVDPEVWHHYQPGWTLVGGGLKDKEDLRRPLDSLIDPKLKRYTEAVVNFFPDQQVVSLSQGQRLSYEQLVVAPGIQLNISDIKGLREALRDPDSMVSSTYSYDTCDKVFRDIQRMSSGKAIFTQPAGIVKCAGGPQKIMWLALDRWKKHGLYKLRDPSNSDIQITFATGIGAMFGVPKYSERLNQLRIERGVEGLFQHDLVAVDGNTAIFNQPDGKGQINRPFDFLHAVPKMGPHDFIKNSPLANEAGLVDVNSETTQHVKYSNVWSLGDASSLPTSKTAAAITGQAPILVQNLLRAMQHKDLEAKYNGYTSCPLLTQYGKVMLAEFKYGGQPEETFNRWFGIDQGTPRRAFYHLKKDFFPWVYYKSLVKGTWAGAQGWIR